MSLPDRSLNYMPAWNLATIPDEIFASEVGRRRVAKRITQVPGTGRPKKPANCPKCQAMCESTVAAREHCRKPRSAQ